MIRRFFAIYLLTIATIALACFLAFTILWNWVMDNNELTVAEVSKITQGLSPTEVTAIFGREPDVAPVGLPVQFGGYYLRDYWEARDGSIEVFYDRTRLKVVHRKVHYKPLVRVFLERLGRKLGM